MKSAMKRVTGAGLAGCCAHRHGFAWRLLLPGLLATLAGCSGDGDFRALQTFPMAGQSIIVEAAGGPGDDGATPVRVRRVAGEEDIIVFEASIANDGEDLTLENLRPDMRTLNDLRLCLNGTGQEDVYVRMDVVARISSSAERTCTQ